MAFELPSYKQLVEAIRHPVRWYREGGPDDPFEADVRRKRIRMVGMAIAFLVAVGLGFCVYVYFMTLDARSETAYLEGERFLRPNGYQEAIAKFDHAIALNSRNDKAHLARGEVLALLGDRDGAMKAFTKVIELKPDWARGYAARGKLYRDAGDNVKALADLNVSVEIEANPENLLERGQALAALGQWQKAIADYTLYIKLREGVPYPYRLRAIARKQIGDEAGAKEDRIQMLIYEGKLPTLFGKTGPNGPPPDKDDDKK